MLDNCESTIIFNNLVEAKKETKNILIEEKKCKDLVIYFTRYIHSKPMKNDKPVLSWINEKG